MPARTVILGMGNPILTDDAVGVHLARDAAEVFGVRDDVDVVVECSVGGLNLLDLLEGYERAIVLDAVQTRDGRPGDCYHFTGRALGPSVHLNNVHDANFATALALGRTLGHDLPDDDRIHVFAVEVVDVATFGTDFSPALQHEYADCRRIVLEGIAHLLATEEANAHPGGVPWNGPSS